MTRTEHLLDILIEECAEVIQRATKAKRFGLNEKQPEHLLDNAERLTFELADLYAVVEMLEECDALTTPHYLSSPVLNAKKQKVEKYLAYSAEQCGTLT